MGEPILAPAPPTLHYFRSPAPIQFRMKGKR